MSDLLDYMQSFADKLEGQEIGKGANSSDTNTESVPPSLKELVERFTSSLRAGEFQGQIWNPFKIGCFFESDPRQLIPRSGWSASANRLASLDSSRTGPACVIFPRSTAAVSQTISTFQSLVDDVNAAWGQGTSKFSGLAVVCGGHSSSNVATSAHNAVVIDLQLMNNIWVSTSDSTITVQGGVLLKDAVLELQKATSLQDHPAMAIPTGTGPTVGLMGFALNGGLSGFTSKFFGLAGQALQEVTLVLPNGEVMDKVTAESHPRLFEAISGAGSALGCVTEATFKLREASHLRAGQLVFPANSRSLQCTLRFLRDHVLNDPHVSMEMMILEAGKVCVCTFVFHESVPSVLGPNHQMASSYPTFESTEAFVLHCKSFVEPLKQTLQNFTTILQDNVGEWDWFNVASSAWEPLTKLMTLAQKFGRTDHCGGALVDPNVKPSDVLSDFYIDELIRVLVTNLPVDDAPFAIVEFRTLGGVIPHLPSIPSGNTKITLFWDLILQYDASADARTVRERSQLIQRHWQWIQSEVSTLHSKLSQPSRFVLGMSGTHGQSDDKEDVAKLALFGGERNIDLVRRAKKNFDPFNVFPFHPFARAVES